MPLWGTVEYTSGNTKPKFANNSNIYGVDKTEATLYGKGVTPGWVEFTRGRGPIASITISNAGFNVTTAGFVTLTAGGAYSNANISYGINNVSNTVNSVVLVNRGDGYVTIPEGTVSNTVGFPGYPAIIAITMGGRFNRNTTETLVVVKALAGDNENVIFPNA